MSEAVHLGLAGYFATRLHDAPDRASKLAELLVDKRWPISLSSVRAGVIESFTKQTRRRRIAGATGATALRELLHDPGVRALDLDHGASSFDVNLYIETGTRAVGGHTRECPFQIEGQTRVAELDSLEAFLEVVHQIMIALDVVNAVLPVWPSAMAARADVACGRVVIDSRWRGVIQVAPTDELERENLRVNYWRPKLGRTYVRYPRWGTYLRRTHLEQIGGLQRVRAAVDFAKVVEVGELIYFQLTNAIADALGSECEAKRKAFARVLEPIVAPRRPVEPAQ